jgi:8-oxo-dGTP diphosphatase
MNKSQNFPECFYRLSIKGLYVQDRKVLLIKDGPNLSGQWELPGGGLDFGEDIRSGLEREIEEEMGLDVISVSKNPVYAWVERSESRREMDWYYAAVLVYEIEFKNLDFTPTEECVEIGFFSKDDL